jgi:transcriptional regulator with XRE-family HTH domain
VDIHIIRYDDKCMAREEQASRNTDVDCARLMPRKRQRRDGPPSIGARLATLRQAKGITQVELAEAIGSNQRNISYYESDHGQAPPLVLAKIARALGVTTDEILGVRPVRRTARRESPRNQQLWKRFQLLIQLPERDQRAVMRMISSLAAAKGLLRREPKEVGTNR